MLLLANNSNWATIQKQDTNELLEQDQFVLLRIFASYLCRYHLNSHFIFVQNHLAKNIRRQCFDKCLYQSTIYHTLVVLKQE